ncbi:MAG TPA: hypothetical protein VHQ41_00745 [Patescibacteria group bacterium]|jgi:hypothetical protein|nr:hypothetical protein [Patescibacteria group bacterium]
MFYERSESSMGSEAEKFNVIEFPSKEKVEDHAVQHILKEAGSHDSPVLLSESELSKAEAELDKLKSEKARIMNALNKGIMTMSLGNQKAREANKSITAQNVTEIGNKVHKLERDIAFTKASANVDHQQLDQAA